MTITYEKIQTVTCVSNQATLEFSVIPQTYTDLVFVSDGKSQAAGGGSLFLRVNGDNTAGNYYGLYTFSSGSSIGVGTTSNGMAVSRHSTTNGMGWAHIFNYSNNTTFKSSFSRGGGNNISIILNSTWNSTAPITSIIAYFESGPGFAPGFTATLYGIKAI